MTEHGLWLEKAPVSLESLFYLAETWHFKRKLAALSQMR